jgi:dTDP-4-amino-4,6-dideoxygalactose transaminase
LNKGAGDYEITELLAEQILSLPIFPELTDEEALYVVDCINSFK